MLKIYLKLHDDLEATPVRLEHSLVAISKWESIHEKPFYGKEPKTGEETLSYINQMVVTEDLPDDWTEKLSEENYTDIAGYINSKSTATFFREDAAPKSNSEVVTSELIYYWLVQFNIPFKPVDEWHINRLMVLIKIAGIKQSPPKKMDKKAIAEHYRQLNAERKQKLGTSG